MGSHRFIGDCCGINTVAGALLPKAHVGELACANRKTASGRSFARPASPRRFLGSIRPGLPSMVIDEAAVPSMYCQHSAPRLKRQELLSKLKGGVEVEGVALSNLEPVLSVRVR